MKQPHLCLIEDDLIMGESLSDRFSLEGFTLDWYRRGSEAIDAMRDTQYAAVISDVRLPDVSGEQVFAVANESITKTPPFVFITAFATVESAVAMLKLGAVDYITKPFDITDLVSKVRTLVGVGSQPVDIGNTTLGISPSMRALAGAGPRIAERAQTVLFTGESGVGKEIVARFLHSLSEPQRSGAFVAVNCGAIPDTLLEVEFFGHERGAFTGAERAKKGYLEQADGGTLFLDEIGDLPQGLQVKLLRVIQERKVQRVGSETSIPVDIRVYCATNRDLVAMVREGRFRDDLYYRINVVHLKVAALRDRPDDVLWLAYKFLEEQAARLRESPRLLSLGAQSALVSHAWPGNIRELRNRIERACVMSISAALTASDLFEDSGPELSDEASTAMPSLEAFVADVERTYIGSVLRRFDGRIGAAAAALKISRKTLWEKMRRYGMRGSDQEIH